MSESRAPEGASSASAAWRSRNGLLVHGPTHWAAAVAAPSDGELEGGLGPQADASATRSTGLPGIRGVAAARRGVRS